MKADSYHNPGQEKTYSGHPETQRENEPPYSQITYDVLFTAAQL